MTVSVSQPRLVLPALRTMLYVASLLVFLVGIPLNFLTNQTERFFAWTISVPLTIAFLGAGYWAAGVLEFLGARQRVWVRARIAIPTVFIFTSLTLIVTLLHLDRFHFHSPLLITRVMTWFWLLVYASVAPSLGVLLIMQLRVAGKDPRRQTPGPLWLWIIFAIQALIMIPLGLILLITPDVGIAIWPWDLTTLTGRAIGAWVFSVGIAALHIALEHDLERVEAATLSYSAVGLFELTALARFASAVNWNMVNTWIYAIFLFSLFFAGLIGWIYSRRKIVKA